MPSAEDVMIMFEGVDNVSGVTSGIKSEINGIGSSASESGGSISGALSEAATSFGTLNGIIASTVGTLAGKSLSDLIVGNAETKETNQVLLTGMADTQSGVSSLYDTIDEATNNSLVSMNQLIPALKTFSAETGLNGSSLEEVVPQFAQFGSYMLAMTGSSEIATTAMTKLSNGISGSSQFLKRYGISQEVLKEKGWSGQEDDVTGYMNAVMSAIGDTDEFMNTTSGSIKILNKQFSSAGKSIGEDILPVIKGVAQGLVGLNNWSGKTLFKGFLYAASGLDLLITGLGQFTVIVKGIESVSQSFKAFGAVGTAIKSKFSGADKLVDGASKDKEVAGNAKVSASNKELTTSNAGLASSNAEVGTSFEALNAIKQSTSSVNASLIGENESLIASNETLAESNATVGATGKVGNVVDLTEEELNSAASHANTVPVVPQSERVPANLGSLESETSQVEKNTSSILKNNTAKTGLKEVESILATGSAEAVGSVGAEGEAFAGAGTSAGLFGSGIMGAIGPLLIIAAVIAVVVVAVYELGKAFGWWSDVGSMIDSIKSGVQRLWAAFAGSSAVKGIVKTLQMGFQTLKNIIVDVSSVISTVFGEIFGYMGSSDPVQNIINSFGKLTPIINNISKAFQGAFSFINSILASFMDQWNVFANSSEGQQLFASVRQAFQALGQAWNQLQPAIGQIVSAFGQLFGALTGSSGGGGSSSVAAIMVQGLVIILKVAVVVIRLVAVKIQILVEVIKTIATVISTVAGGISWFIGVVQSIGSAVQHAGQMIANFPKYLASLPGQIGQFVNSSLQKILQFASKMGTNAMKAGKNFLNGIVNNIKTLPTKLWTILLKTIQHLLQFDTKGKVEAIKAGMNIVNGVINWVKQLPAKIGQWFTSAVGRILNFVGQAMANAQQVGMGAVNGVVNWVKTLPGKVYNEFIKIGQKIHDSVSSAVSAATSFGSDIVSAVMGALHIASPGIIQRSIAKEFADIPGRISESNSDAEGRSKSFAESIKKGFGKPKLNVGTALNLKTNNASTMADYQKHLQNQLKLKTQAVNLAAGGVKAIGGTQIVQKHVHLSKGAVPIDARNMTQREAEKVVISALEQWGNTSTATSTTGGV